MILIRIYLLIMLYTGVHELGHAAAARLIGVPVLKIRIGGGEPVIAAGKYELALWITGGYTDVSAAELSGKSILEKLLFFEGGTVFSLLLWFALSAVSDGLAAGMNTAVFFIPAFTNHCPFLPGSDMERFLSSVKEGRPDGGGGIP